MNGVVMGDKGWSVYRSNAATGNGQAPRPMDLASSQGR